MPTVKTGQSIASIKKISPFRYPGGKTWFVPIFQTWLTTRNRKPLTLVEPFAGGGAVGLSAIADGLISKLVLIEIDVDVAAVWQTVLHPSHNQLIKLLTKFEFTKNNVKRLIDSQPRSTLGRAFRTLVRNRATHGGILAPGAGLMKKGERGKGLASRWYPETLCQRIRTIWSLKNRIKFIHGSAFDYLDSYLETKNCALFLDPPYTGGKKNAGRRLYRHHDLDHEKLIRTISASPADFILTYDDCHKIRKLAVASDLDFHPVAMLNTQNQRQSELVIGKNLASLKAGSRKRERTT